MLTVDMISFEADARGTVSADGQLLTAEEAEDLSVALRYLADLLLDDVDLESCMLRIADLAVGVVPGCDMASVTLLGQNRTPTTVAATDPQAREIDETQYAADDGPCLRAARENATVQVDGAEAWQQWPSVAEVADRHGVLSFLAAPLVIRDGPIGALNLFGRGSNAFDSLDETLLNSYRRQAAISLTNARLYQEATTVADQMRAAMASRAVIEQAKGMVAVLNGIGVDEAFELMRQRSQHQNVKLRSLAEEIVASQRW